MCIKRKFILLISIIFIVFMNVGIYASDLEFSEDAIANRYDTNQADEYKIEDSLEEAYGVDNIFTDENSSLEGEYTTEGLFEGESQEVSLVSGEFDDIFVDNISYHEMYESDNTSSLIYKITLVILVVGISYFLTNIYIMIRQRRKNAKTKNRS